MIHHCIVSNNSHTSTPSRRPQRVSGSCACTAAERWDVLLGCVHAWWLRASRVERLGGREGSGAPRARMGSRQKERAVMLRPAKGDADARGGLSCYTFSWRGRPPHRGRRKERGGVGWQGEVQNWRRAWRRPCGVARDVVWRVAMLGAPVRSCYHGRRSSGGGAFGSAVGGAIGGVARARALLAQYERCPCARACAPAARRLSVSNCWVAQVAPPPLPRDHARAGDALSSCARAWRPHRWRPSCRSTRSRRNAPRAPPHRRAHGRARGRATLGASGTPSRTMRAWWP